MPDLSKITALRERYGIPLKLAKEVVEHGLVEKLKADAWDEGWKVGFGYPPGQAEHAPSNPYRREAKDES